MIDLSKPYPFGLSRRNWPLFAWGFAAILFGLLLVDHPLSLLASNQTQQVTQFFAEITRWGESDWILYPSLALLVLSALVAWAIPKRIPKLALIEMSQMYGFIFLGVGIPGLAANLLKRIIGRTRPDFFANGGTLGFHTLANNYHYESFPSGHATTAFAAAMVLGFLSPRWFAVGLIYAVAICLSRVELGVHYPTDVFGGIVLGVLGAYAVRDAFAKRRWGFERLPSGDIVRRDAVAVQRLIRPRQRKLAV